MRRYMSYITLSVIISTSFYATTGLPASADKAPNPSIEKKKEKKIVQEQAHPRFGWGTPGPTSPILHPGHGGQQM